MVWVTPPARSNGDIVTAAIWNQDVKDNAIYLKGLSGPVSGGRVSLSGANMLYAPDQSNRCRLYDGTEWVEKTNPDAGITTPATGLTPSTDYYMYVYDNAGTLTLDMSTALPTTQNGIQVKTGPAGWLLVARCRTNAAGAIIDTRTGSDATVVGIGYCNVFNARLLSFVHNNSTDSWTYNATAWRQTGNVATDRITVVSLGVEAISLMASTLSYAADGTSGRGGIGVDSTTVNSAAMVAQSGGTIAIASHAAYGGILSAGSHYLQLLEACGAANVVTFYGDGGSTGMSLGAQILLTGRF